MIGIDIGRRDDKIKSYKMVAFLVWTALIIVTAQANITPSCREVFPGCV